MVLKLGNKGPDVAKWQNVLNQLGFLDPHGRKLGEDGDFGSFTDFATRQFQAAYHLQVDGVVGDKSWGKATELLAVADTIPPEQLIRGTDLSAIQGDLTDKDWEALAKLDIKFAMLRLVVGNESWTDAGVAKRNAERAKAHGIHCGAYFFPYPLPHLDPKQQIERFLKVLEGVGVAIGEMPPAYDAEWPPREEWKVINNVKTLTYPWKKWGCSASQLRDWHLAALNHGETLLGIQWLLYSYRYHLKCLEAEKAPELATRKLWLADYGLMGKWPSVAEVQKLKSPAPWTALTIVQHDGDGGLKLPNGRDADFNVFLGGDKDLVSLVGEVGIAGVEAKLPENLIMAYGAPSSAGMIGEDGIRTYRRDRLNQATEETPT